MIGGIDGGIPTESGIETGAVGRGRATIMTAEP